MLGRRLEALEQAVRTGKPATGHRALTTKRAVIPRQPSRHPRGITTPVLLAEQLVRALPRRERRIRVVQPPRRHTQALQRLGALGDRDRRAEHLLGPDPVATRQGLLPGGYRIGDRGHRPEG
jgi:hypothetical protein